MNNEQALLVLKQVLDAAVSKSVFPNMDVAFQAANAYNQIADVVKASDKSKKDPIPTLELAD